jgi:hypothetical protein
MADNFSYLQVGNSLNSSHGGKSSDGKEKMNKFIVLNSLRFAIFIPIELFRSPENIEKIATEIDDAAQKKINFR